MTKTRTKILIFSILDTSRLKKLIYSVNPLYLRINHASGYIEEKNGNKYLVFDFADENKKVLKKYTDILDGIKNEIKTINGGKEND